MIAALREWLTSIVVVTLLISLVEMLIPEGTIRKTASFIGGLVLITAMLHPLLDVELGALDASWEDYGVIIEAQRQELELAGQAQIAAGVERNLAVCVQEKSKELGIAVTAVVRTEIASDGTPVPTEVILEGDYDAGLASWIELELGVSKKQQIWKTAS